MNLNTLNSLNSLAAALCREIADRADALQVRVETAACGTMLIDCGIAVPGSLEAAILVARVCLADLADVSLDDATTPWPTVNVSTREPVRACLASQYAGWEIKAEKYFAMGSGPMRAAAAREPLFQEIGFQESSEFCVGVLESSKLPTEAVCRDLATKCGIAPEQLTLLVASTSSLCGTLQIVARSVETALHKLHELGFDLTQIVTGTGTAPLPPLAENDFAAIGRTNDAILYGGRVALEVRSDDLTLQQIGPQIPSSASADYGLPFAEILARNDNDFYRVDPLLFSPAEIELINLNTGNYFCYGEVNSEVLRKSFA